MSGCARVRRAAGGTDRLRDEARGDGRPTAGAGLVAFAELAFEPFHPREVAGPHVERLAETVPGPIVEAFQRKARELGVVGGVLARAATGTDEILHADVDLAQVASSHARQLFMRHRRPDRHVSWVGR